MVEAQLSNPGSAFKEDARYKRLEAIIGELERRMKTTYTHRISTADAKVISLARKDLHSIGVQLERTYLDQLPLVPDVEPRKVVQKR